MYPTFVQWPAEQSGWLCKAPGSPWCAICVAYNVVSGDEQDLASYEVWNIIIQDTWQVLSNASCNTHTNARKDDGVGQLPLRGLSGAARYGLPNLPAVDKDKVKIGTLLVARTAEAAEAFHEEWKWKDEEQSVSMC